MLPRPDEISLLRRVIEAVCIVTAVGFWTVHFALFAIYGSSGCWLCIVLAAAGMATADFASGLIHWIADTWGRVRANHRSSAASFLAAMFGISLDWSLGQHALAIMLGLTGVGFWTNQMSHPPRAVRWMQCCRMILNRQVQERHHLAPHTTDYCITTGWCYAPLRLVGFFPRAESAITWATGLVPREDEVGDNFRILGTNMSEA